MDLPSHQVYLGIVAILAFIGWAGLARVIRGLVLSMRKSDYVTAAEALGFGRLRVIARHVLPNTMSYVIVAATLSIPGYILGEVILSFLGVGVQEPSASWGNMLNQARSIRALTSFPWLLFVPGTAIFVTVMAFNFLGDGLRDALDPRRVSGGTSMSEPLAAPREPEDVLLHRHGRHRGGRRRVVRGESPAKRWPWSASRAAARA